MSTDAGIITWRVSAQKGGVRAQAFDALVLPHATTPSAGGERHVGLAVPFEGALSDGPQTLVVRTRPGAGPLVVEFHVHAADGSRRMSGRSTGWLTAIVRSDTGMTVTGLPDAADEPFAPPPGSPLPPGA